MAFSIYIYEKDNLLYEAIKQRLSHYFPEAYIVNPYVNTNITTVSDYTIILYDNRNYKLPSTPQNNKCEYINLFSTGNDNHHSIDCSRIYYLIKNLENKFTKETSITSKGSLDILLPFAYIDEREKFITEKFISNDKNIDYTLRFDLCSGIRMPSSFKTGLDCGSLTDLLDDVVKQDFIPIKILDYLNPDISGFLTPGKPLKPDDVFDVNINNITMLLSLLRELIAVPDFKSNALVICEGWKTSQILKFAEFCDNFHILLPHRMSDETKGIQDLVNAIKRNISPKSNLFIHYCEDYRKEKQNEPARV